MFVDGTELLGREQALTAGAKTVVSVAPGFYGEVRSLSLSVVESQKIEIALQPSALPTAQELRLLGSRT